MIPVLLSDGVTPNPLWMNDIKFATYDETGRLRGGGHASTAAIELLKADGTLVIPVSIDVTHKDEPALYVDLTGPVPQLVSRPTLDRQLKPAEVKARQEAVLADLPACRVGIVGPWSGTHEHPGGDLKLGFTIPGIYQITVEPFPVRKTTLELVVTL